MKGIRGGNIISAGHFGYESSFSQGQACLALAAELGMAVILPGTISLTRSSTTTTKKTTTNVVIMVNSSHSFGRFRPAVEGLKAVK